MAKLILAIDQGTTATTVLLIDSSLNVVSRASDEILPTYPRYGWVEHDLEKIWDGTQKTIADALKGHSAEDVAAVSITNQRETVGAWHRTTGKPFHHAIVWQCRRTAERCEELRKEPGLIDHVRRTTGLVIDPYFSGTKIEWLLKNVPGLGEKAASGDAIFGTIDTFLLHRLTGGAAYATDVSNASRLMLMDLKSLAWDPRLLKTFGVPVMALPQIMPSAGEFGRTKGLGVLPDGIPIAGILGDQQAALFGQLCLSPGDAKCTYGTGSFLMCNTGSEIVYSKHGLLTTVAWKIGGQITYALEGSSFVAGAAVQFLRDNLGIIKSSGEVEALALEAKPEEMGDLVFVPALTGLGAPYWEAHATGMIHGLTRGTKRSHLARATLEGIALQNDALFAAVAEDIKPKKMARMKVDGGASANNTLMQLQCDLASLPIDRPKILDTTALGSGLAAGLAVGLWKNLEELKHSWKIDKSFTPSMKEETRSALKTKWARAIRKVLAP
ncbi:MAG: glycerol kinase GlpK [Bdellovibrionota bacterium]